MHFKEPQATSCSLPFRSVMNLIIVPIQINNSDRLWFILDSGSAFSLITGLPEGKSLNLNASNEVMLRDPENRNGPQSTSLLRQPL